MKPWSFYGWFCCFLGPWDLCPFTLQPNKASNPVPQGLLPSHSYAASWHTFHMDSSYLRNRNNNKPYQPRPHSHSCPATHPEPAKVEMNGKCILKSLQLAYSDSVGKSAPERQHHTIPQEHNEYKPPRFGVANKYTVYGIKIYKKQMHIEKTNSALPSCHLK